MPFLERNKAGCVCPGVIWSKFRMEQCRDHDHREDAPHFKHVK